MVKMLTHNKSLMIISGPQTRDKLILVALIGLSVFSLQAPATTGTAADALELNRVKQQDETNSIKQHGDGEHGSNNDKDSSSANRKSSLEAELESIVQQHDGSFDPTDRSLADAIISRLMMDNLANELSTSESDADELLGGSRSGEASIELGLTNEQAPLQQQQQLFAGRAFAGATGPEALRLKKLLSMVQAYESMLNSGLANSALGYGALANAAALPMLPAGQAATSKRASKLASNYLQQRQMIPGGGNNPNGYGRSSFDFGLGKRPDSALRFGDSLGGGGVQAVNQFGKRPGAHRYDFGLGKRVASSGYPRYDFGLGKRAPIRYDFGLGK